MRFISRFLASGRGRWVVGSGLSLVLFGGTALSTLKKASPVKNEDKRLAGQRQSTDFPVYQGEKIKLFWRGSAEDWERVSPGLVIRPFELEGILQTVLLSSPDNVKKNLPILNVFVLEKADRQGVFVGPDTVFLDLKVMRNPSLKSLIAHEFFHFIHFTQNPLEKSWVKEGLAQWVEYRYFRTPNSGFLLSALSQSQTPLEGEFDLNRPNANQYGHSFLFFRFLLDRCVKHPIEVDALFWKLVVGETGKSGRDTLQAVLAKLNPSVHEGKEECRDFIALAKVFEVARFHNQMDMVSGYRNQFYLFSTTSILGDWSEIKVDASQMGQRLKVPFFPVFLPAQDELPAEVLGNKLVVRYWSERVIPYRVLSQEAWKAQDEKLKVNGKWVQMVFLAQ